MFRVSARTSVCRTRMNCRMWGISFLIIAISEDPQPSEATGSPRPQLMWEASSGPSRRTVKPFWCWARGSASL